MIRETTALGWAWIGYTTLGYFFGLFFGFPLAAAFESVAGGVVSVLLLPGSIGGGVAIAQRVVLRRRLPGFEEPAWKGRLEAGRRTVVVWVLAGLLGLPAGFVLAGLAAGAAGTEYAFELSGWRGVFWWAVALASGGALTGLPQSLALRAHVRRSAWWMAASTLGWAASVGGFALVVLLFGGSTLWFILGAPVVAGLVLGAVTGPALARLSTRSNAPAPAGT